jgi:hypothetical protein
MEPLQRRIHGGRMATFACSGGCVAIFDLARRPQWHLYPIEVVA